MTRLALCFLSLVLLAAVLPIPAGAKTGAKAKTAAQARKPAAVSPASTRVLTISCSDQSGSGDQALAIALLATDDSGAFSMSLYMKPAAAPYTFKQIAGKATSVPDGLVFSATNWASTAGTPFFLHAHPRDQTTFPGSSGRYQCHVTGDMKP